MNRPETVGPSWRAPVLGFLALGMMVLALTVAGTMHLIEPAAAQRGLGLIVGLMTLVIGNFLPKLRPIPSFDRVRAAAVELFAGRILVVAGIAYVAMFLFAPLASAKVGTSLIGIAAMAMIAGKWRVRAVQSRRGPGAAPAPHEPVTAARKIAIWLLFAYFQILTTLCTAFLFGGAEWADDLKDWLLLAWMMVYAVLFAVLGRRVGTHYCSRSQHAEKS